jgi:hypothetical protein
MIKKYIGVLFILCGCSSSPNEQYDEETIELAKKKIILEFVEKKQIRGIPSFYSIDFNDDGVIDGEDRKIFIDAMKSFEGVRVTRLKDE